MYFLTKWLYTGFRAKYQARAEEQRDVDRCCETSARLLATVHLTDGLPIPLTFEARGSAYHCAISGWVLTPATDRVERSFHRTAADIAVSGLTHKGVVIPPHRVHRITKDKVEASA